PDVDTVLIPWGGGGLASGIATALRALKPSIRIFAVEADTGAPLTASLKAGSPQAVDYQPSFVDGIGSKTVFKNMLELAQELLDGSFTASLEEIAAALRLMAERNRVIAEGAGAVALAVALSGKAGQGRIACVISGGNIDRPKLAKILGERSQVDDMVAQVGKALGNPLILVNNAGIAGSAKLSETTDDMWDAMLRVNATGAFYCMRALVPMMVDAKWGRVVNIASIAARAGAAYIAAYSASKHALLGLTRAIAAEVAAKGVTVNAICPGYVDTEMTDRSAAFISARTRRNEQEARKILEGFSPQQRLMTAEEVAGIAA